MRALLLLLLVVASVAAVSATAAAAGPGPVGGRAAAAGAGSAAHAGAADRARPAARRRRCDRNYSGRCLRPNVSDYDCAGGGGNGPYYVRGPFRVVGTDHYRLDSDHDGIACES